MNFTKTKIEPNYHNPEGVAVFNIKDIALPDDFDAKEQYFVKFPPGGVGGNHKHPRTEIFLVTGDGMTFVWQDKDGIIHHESMCAHGYFLYRVNPWLPHAVINNSKDSIGTMIEFADGPQTDVEHIKLI